MQTVTDLRRLIIAYDLSRPADFDQLTDAELTACYNGIGAAWFPAFLRAGCTAVLNRMEPLALIHDVEFTRAPRTYRAFSVANLRWAFNACRIAGKTVIMPGRWRFLCAALLCAAACQLGGFRGYRHSEKAA